MLWANHKLRLMVTNQCNLNCFYCHNEGQPKAGEFLSDQLFLHILSVARNYGAGLERVTFSGGEPLLHNGLERFVEALKPLTKQRTVVTNGLLLDSRRIVSLRNAGITRMRIGVDSLAQPQSRPSSDCAWNRSIHEILGELQAEGMPCELNVILTEYNRRELPGLFEYCRDHQVSAKFFEHVKVTPTRDKTGIAVAGAQPYVSFCEFESVLRGVMPTIMHEGPDMFDGANEVFRYGDCTIRYCRYLCGYGLCHLTGTRIDPRGFVYTCLAGNGRFRLSTTQTTEESARVIERAVNCGCSAQSAVVETA